MQKKIIAAGITAMTLGAVLLPSTFAAETQNGGGLGLKAKGGENRVAIEAALESGDYAAWQKLVPTRLASKIDEVEFEDLAAEYKERETHREAVQAAVTSGNYNTWKTLITEENPDAPILEKITASNFAKFSELHKLREQARTLETELGLEGPGGMGMGGGKMGGGMRGGMGGGHMGFGDEPTQE